VDTQRRPVRLIAPGIYTTFDGEYRVENLRIATRDEDQEDKWEVYLQNEPGVSPDTLDQRASFISGHEKLDDAIRALGEIKGKEHVTACLKDCRLMPVQAGDLRPGQFVDLEEDPLADPDCEHRRYEWEFMEVIAVHRETPDGVRVDFDGVSIGFPADYVLSVLNDERSGTPGARPA
jgi:hypothetical protein